MKTHVFTQRRSFKPFRLTTILFALFAFTTITAQVNSTRVEISTNERDISGIVSDINGPLDSVNVIQKGTRNGTITNNKGEFKFPVKLKSGDILVFSYLGYEKKEIEIKDNTTYITVTLNEDAVEMIGALDSGKPYKSKRKN